MSLNFHGQITLVILYAVDAVPCRISFERGKERHFRFLAMSMGTSGWLVLAEELPLKQGYGLVRVVAPLAGSSVSIWFSFINMIDHTRLHLHYTGKL